MYAAIFQRENYELHGTLAPNARSSRSDEPASPGQNQGHPACSSGIVQRDLNL